MSSNDQTTEVRVHARRVEWRHRLGVMSWLIDLDTGRTIARILKEGDGDYVALIAFGAAPYESTHGSEDSAVRWVMERI